MHKESKKYILQGGNDTIPAASGIIRPEHKEGPFGNFLSMAIVAACFGGDTFRVQSAIYLLPQIAMYDPTRAVDDGWRRTCHIFDLAPGPKRRYIIIRYISYPFFKTPTVCVMEAVKHHPHRKQLAKSSSAY